jgi:hypothetical protein
VQYVGLGATVTVSDLHNPRPLGIGATEPLPANVEGLAANSGLLVAAIGGSGIFVYSISDPHPAPAHRIA